jgi:HK97 family phage major capsid protein
LKHILAQRQTPHPTPEQLAWFQRVTSFLPDVQPTLPKGTLAARMIKALAASKGNPQVATALYKKNHGDDVAYKALAATDATAGGFLIPEIMSADIIELLRPASAFRRLNPVIVPMNAGNLHIPKMAGGAAAGYIGENQNLPKTQPTFGDIAATAKKLGALVPISNDLLRRADAGSETMVRNDLVAALAQRSDLAFIRDDGTAGTPKGLRYWVPSSNVLPANGTVNLVNVTTDLGLLMLALLNGNVRMLSPGWLMSPRTYIYLTTVRDGNGNFVFRQEMLGGSLWGFPFAFTTQIPINLGGGSNESELYFADFADVVIAEATQILIDSSSEAAYHDGVQVVAAFSLDQTVIRAILEHDMVLRHAESVAVLTGVLWGT